MPKRHIEHIMINLYFWSLKNGRTMPTTVQKTPKNQNQTT